MEKILVIEDDVIVRSNTVEVLGQEGFKVLEAENGKAGLDIAKKLLPDLIISDILMPEMDGYSVLEELQKDITTCSIPFIFLSARTSDIDIRQGMLKGADDYLQKPVKIKDLLDTIKSRLSKHRYIDAKLEELYNHIAKFLPHELRTPLVSILGFSEFIKESSGSITLNEIMEMVGKINIAGHRLFSLVQKFLQYSEISSLLNDREQLQCARNAYISSVKNSVAAYALLTAQKFGRENDLILELIDSDVNISENHLEILLSEIIENSSKFSQNNSPIIISSKVEDNCYIIEITDQGIGMSFYQIKNTGLMKQFDRDFYNQSGAGIGFALARKIVELYSGTFELKSILGKYTKVTISLPVHENKDI